MGDKAAKRKALVVIEDSLLAVMAASVTYTKEFPFLKSLATPLSTKPGGCGKCGKSNRDMSQAFRAAKAAISSLPSERKRRLKELVGAERLRVTYINPANKRVIVLTF